MASCAKLDEIIVNQRATAFNTQAVFVRQNPYPIDASGYFYDLEIAKKFAKGEETGNKYQDCNVSYVGQQITVIDKAEGYSDSYIIQNAAGDLDRVITVGNADFSKTVVFDANDETETEYSQIIINSNKYCNFLVDGIEYLFGETGDYGPTSNISDTDLTKARVEYERTITTQILATRKWVNSFLSSRIDSELSATSENPVQNKAIYAALKDIQDRLNNIEILLEAEWKQTTLKIENADNIDQTDAGNFYLETESEEE